MVMGIELDHYTSGHRDGLMYGAAMRHFEESLAVCDRDAMRQMNRQCDLVHPMRPFCHGPLRLDAQPFGRDLMAVAVATHEISHTTGERTDEKFDRTHASILAPVRGRLVSHHPMRTARNIVAGPTMIYSRKLHGTSRQSPIVMHRLRLTSANGPSAYCTV
jgi:hypothetical protein